MTKKDSLEKRHKTHKKKLAAIAAVANYIKTEQEAMTTCQVPPSPPDVFETPPLVLNLWGIGGRQQQMQMRQMMQMKAFHGARVKF